jgi:hypothetical protein
MSLVLAKAEGETWRDAAVRYARAYGLGAEVAADYERFRKSGDSEAAAAWSACYEWDVLDFRDEPENPTNSA